MANFTSVPSEPTFLPPLPAPRMDAICTRFFLISSVSLPYVKAQESMRHAFIH